MPFIGENKGADDVIDVVSIDNNGSNGNLNANGNGTLNNGNGSVNEKIMEINKIPEKVITLDQFISNLASSGNAKHEKLASELIDLDMTQEIYFEKLKSDCFDKISASENEKNKENVSENDLET